MRRTSPTRPGDVAGTQRLPSPSPGKGACSRSSAPAAPRLTRRPATGISDTSDRSRSPAIQGWAEGIRNRPGCLRRTGTSLWRTSPVAGLFPDLWLRLHLAHVTQFLSCALDNRAGMPSPVSAAESDCVQVGQLHPPRSFLLCNARLRRSVSQHAVSHENRLGRYITLYARPLPVAGSECFRPADGLHVARQCPSCRPATPSAADGEVGLILLTLPASVDGVEVAKHAHSLMNASFTFPTGPRCFDLRR